MSSTRRSTRRSSTSRIWDLGVAGLVIWADRRFQLGHGRAFALYVMAYTAGRGWIEYLRVDTVNHIFGLRLNVWTSIVLFVLATIYFVVVGRTRPGARIRHRRAACDGDDGAGRRTTARGGRARRSDEAERDATPTTRCDADRGCRPRPRRRREPVRRA